MHGEGNRLCTALVLSLAGGDGADGVVPVHLVQVVAAAVAADEMHVDEPGQYRPTVDRGLDWLQQVVHSHRRHRHGVDGQGLHHLPAQRIESLKGLPDQDLHDLARQHVLRCGEQAGQAGVPVGGQDRRQRLQRPRESPGPLADGRQEIRGRFAQPQRARRIHAVQHLDRLGGRQPRVKVKALLPAGMPEQQVTGYQTGGGDHLYAVLGRGQQFAQRSTKLRVAQRQCGRIDHVFEVVQQHDTAAFRELLQQPEHEPARLMRFPVQLEQPLGGRIGQQPGQVGEQVLEADRMNADWAEIHDRIGRQLAAVVRQLPGFQPLEQSADHSGLAHPSAADYGQQAQSVVAQELADEPAFHIPVLEPARRGHRRGIDEPGLARGRLAPGLALLLQAAFDPLLSVLPQVLQYLEDERFQLLRGAHPPHRHPGFRDPRPEAALLFVVTRIGQVLSGQRQDRILIQEEDQSGQALLGGGGELELGIGQGRLVLDW